MHEDDATLLRRYAEKRDEPAFAELVRRHLNLVYYAALRQTGGDAALAEEVAQTVFGELARRAASLYQRPVLAGWLYTSTRFAAHKARRAEQRRRHREHAAHLMNELTHDSATAADWERLRPVLDDALHALDERDREAVILRFFNGCGFAEIGNRLALTEEAARKRVDRALDRMQALLARRGVTSTAAALGAAMTGQAALAAPTGLAASVAGAALTGTGAAASGLGAGLSIFTLMSTIKFTGATVAGLAILAASLVGNAVLLWRTAPAEVSVAATQPAVAPVVAAPSFKALVRADDLAGLRDRLRAAGASDASVRAALEGILRRRYRERLTASRAARMERGWWRDSQRTNGTAADIQKLLDDPYLLRVIVTDPLERLLGPDPVELAEADMRYSFLPEDLRRAFGALDRSVVTVWSPTGDLVQDAKLRNEYEVRKQVADDQKKELLARLTPAQRMDYEMRFGTLAVRLGRQLDPLVPTEQEYRAVFPIADEYARMLESIKQAGDYQARRTDASERAAAQLIASLGYDRALGYIWGGSVEYPVLARVAREGNLPDYTAGRAVQLAAETAARGIAIHTDAALDVDQKRAALLTLQQTARTQFDALYPAAAQQRLTPNALSWLAVLGEGRYKPIGMSPPGASGSIMNMPVAVSTPVGKDGPPRQIVPLRPSN